MIEKLESGVNAAKLIIQSIKKIYKGILNIKDKKRKKEELKRLMDLLDKTRIGRTLNMSLLFYLRRSIEAYQTGGDFIWGNEIDTAIKQIERSVQAILTIVDEMAQQSDKILIYKNKAWTDLSSVVLDRSRTLDELKVLELNEQNLNDLKHLQTNMRSWLISYTIFHPTFPSMLLNLTKKSPNKFCA